VLGRVLDGVTDIEIPERTLMEFLQAVTLRNAPRQTIPDWCANAVNQIESRVDVRYSRLGVARLAGVHPVHLTRSLRRYFGLTTRACLRRAGVARAATLLRTTNASIAQIAYDTGFSDHAHLTREFGRRMGLSPSAYRTSAGRGDVAFIQADRFPATDLGTLRVS
jgi:AraC family transcriptional regulator